MKRLCILLSLILTACGTTQKPPSPPAQSASQTNATTSMASGQDLFALNQISLAAPACDGTFSPSQTEGPYYKANTPEQNVLWRGGMAGKKLFLVGYVLDQKCQPIASAWMDFWQADANGKYDNQGYALRGHQFTDGQGRYLLETVYPGEYPGRTEHIHVKIRPQGGSILTTQIYFPNAPNNSADGIFDPKLLVKLEDHGDYYMAYYTFVVQD
jgi:protocatechuate 3,4-dioxygenase beta subunit